MRRVVVGFLSALLTVIAGRPAAAQSCGGVERWAVKVGSDAGAATINLPNPVSTRQRIDDQFSSSMILRL